MRIASIRETVHFVMQVALRMATATTYTFRKAIKLKLMPFWKNMTDIQSIPILQN